MSTRRLAVVLFWIGIAMAAYGIYMLVTIFTK